MHNGTIRVKSEINKETSFILNIPINKINYFNISKNVQNKNKNYIIQVEFSDFSNYI